MVRVDLLSREPFSGEKYDHEWVSGTLWCDVDLEGCTARLRRPLSMPLEYLHAYARSLDDLAASLTGAAELSSLEPGIELTVRPDRGTGSAVATLAIGDFSGRLSFDAPIDQSMLLPARRGLVTLFDRFPSKRPAN